MSGEAQKAGLWNRVKEHKLVLGAIGFVSGAAIVVGLTADALDVWSHLVPGPASQSASAAAAPSALAGGAGNPSAQSPGSPSSASASPCASRRGGTPVSCRESHRFESLPDPCTTQDLVTVMAGDVQDVPFDRPRHQAAGGCGLDFDSDQDSTVRLALQTGASGDDHWRRCLDMAGSGFVRCDEDHLGEYVGSASDEPATPEECEDQASAYMRSPLGRHADQLQVRAIKKPAEGDSARCLISVLGTQPLTASLRWLDTQSVPVRT